ncbi:hypothetical protein VFES401_18640 [Aliivibrio fischeri]|nr:hypothetical protein VFES401_18640 [Aliivibrio fischeri]
MKQQLLALINSPDCNPYSEAFCGLVELLVCCEE